MYREYVRTSALKTPTFTGSSRTVERAFDASFANGSVWIPGMLSRKKQVMTRILDYVLDKRHPESGQFEYAYSADP